MRCDDFNTSSWRYSIEDRFKEPTYDLLDSLSSGPDFSDFIRTALMHIVWRANLGKFSYDVHQIDWPALKALRQAFLEARGITDNYWHST